MTDSTPILVESVSIVVPVYNAADSLRELVARVEASVLPTTRALELILVNDGSQDTSSAVVAGLVREHRWIRSIELMRNYGQHNALLCGIRSARYDVIVTMDDDLQYAPEEIQVYRTRFPGHTFVLCRLA